MLLIGAGLSQKHAAFLAMLATIFQVFVAGLGIPVQRAGIMASFGFLALLLERERSGLNLFFLAFLAILIWDTRCLWNISFQLSFLSLFCLILFAHYWKGRWPWFEALAGSAAVMAGTLPIVIYHFNTFAPISIITNLLAIPFFHLTLFSALIALAAFWIPYAAAIPVTLAHFFLKAGLAWIHFCALPHWGYFHFLRPGMGIMIFYYGALGILLLLINPKRESRNSKPIQNFKITNFLNFVSKFGFRNSKFLAWGRFAALSVWLLSCAMILRPAKPLGFELTVLAAGSNEIVHLQFADGTHWLINAGRSKPSDQAEWIVAPYLRSKGIKKLKGILFTDYLKRHTAGLETLKRNFLFEYCVGPYLYKENLMLPDTRVIQLRKGDKIRFPDESLIEVLDHFQGRFTLGLTRGGDKFLIFPSDQAGREEKLKQHPWMREPYVAITGDMAKQGAVTFKEQEGRLVAQVFKP